MVIVACRFYTTEKHTKMPTASELKISEDSTTVYSTLYELPC